MIVVQTATYEKNKYPTTVDIKVSNPEATKNHLTNYDYNLYFTVLLQSLFKILIVLVSHVESTEIASQFDPILFNKLSF